MTGGQRAKGADDQKHRQTCKGHRDESQSSLGAPRERLFAVCGVPHDHERREDLHERVETEGDQGKRPRGYAEANGEEKLPGVPDDRRPLQHQDTAAQRRDHRTMIPHPEPAAAGHGEHPWAAPSPNLPWMRRLIALLLALGLAAGGCGDDTVVPTSSTPRSIDAASLDDDLADLVRAAEEVRGLEFFDEPTITIVSSQELADRVKAEIDEDLDPDEMLVFQRLYELLGLLDGSVDLIQAYRDLYAEQVGGFYDHDTGELVVAGDADLTPLSKSIVVHELVHALTDQQYGFGDQTDALVDQDMFEQAAAIQSLVEGDATYFQLVYLQSLPPDEQTEAIQESLDTDTSVLDTLPAWFAEDLTFPYDYGFGFVTRLVAEQGAAGVNQAYTRFPASTEQILHPEKYLAMEPPLEVEVPAVEVPGYEPVEEGVFGEWNLGLYLLGGVDPGEGLIASSGWGGDHYRLYTNGTDVVFLYVYEGDTPRDAEELAASLVSSVSATMPVGTPNTAASGVTTFTGGSTFAYATVTDRTVVFVASREAAAGRGLVESLRGLGVTP